MLQHPDPGYFDERLDMTDTSLYDDVCLEY